MNKKTLIIFILNFSNKDLKLIKKGEIIFYLINKIFSGDWGLGIGDWGLGIGDWAQTPKPQNPTPIKKKKKIKNKK